MYTNPVAISSEHHNRLRFTPAENYSFASAETHVQVMAFEIESLAKHYPIVFDSTSGQPIAILGVKPGENAWLDADSRWRAPVVPAQITCYPFGLAKTGEDQYAVIMDAAADTLQAEKGKLLFNKQGDGYRQSPLLKAMKERLQVLEQQRHLTARAFQQLVAHKVLVARQLEFTLGDESRKVNGFSVIDWEKVQQLSPEVLGEWQQSGLMALLEAQTASLKNFELVVRLQENR